MGRARGLAGFVVDGTVTDIVELRALGLPIYARGTTVAATKVLNVEGAELFGPVTIGGCVVRTGDILLGDENGVLAISPDDPDLARMVADGIAYEAKEAGWRREIEEGKLLADLSGARALIESGGHGRH
jgi:regulator of RNase E activity RraA